ncbi:MAG: type II secretion system protein GspL, partial [Legionella sp.]
LLATKPLNLCQGEMQHSMRADWLKKGYMLSASLTIIWLISIVLVNAINLHSLNKKNNALDQRIAVIYREFFPEAKQVISPRFRISQLLGDQTVNSQSRFWFLLTQLARVLKENNSTPEQIRYQNNLLAVTLISPDFASLERIEEQLKTRQLQVSQTQASTRDEQVFATLELK